LKNIKPQQFKNKSNYFNSKIIMKNKKLYGKENFSFYNSKGIK